ncbi:SdrD B-like domain-containing protein [Streptomyces fractus]|uniref:SdrD B-like domain-containing protein n=1 Tax=Streptomyces fractus TaxID=641806 RepID=UPI003CEE1189
MHEVNGNGAWDNALEPGWEGVEVKLTDDNGLSETGKTGADGTAVISPGVALTGGKYRVEVENPDVKEYTPATAASKRPAGGLKPIVSTVETVDLSRGKKAELTTGFWKPGDFCKNNTRVVGCTMAGGNWHARNEKPSIASNLFTDRGFDKARGVWGARVHSTMKQTGTLYGLGVDRDRRRLYGAAYSRRSADFGPGGPNAIYVTDADANTTKQFATVPGGTDLKHAINSGDTAFIPYVNKTSLGDLDVSKDNSELYVVGLSDKKLYTYDTSKDTASEPKSAVSIPDPGCPGGADNWRPGALGAQDDTVYVGGVCSAESTGKRSDLRAVIYKYDPASQKFGDVVMNDPLNFPKQPPGGRPTPECSGWYPWDNKLRHTDPDTGKGCAESYPMPMMVDIERETNGDLVVGFTDRGANIGVGSLSGGDVNRACPNKDGRYVLDGNGACANHAETVKGYKEQPKEFYPGDHRAGQHMEAATGGLALMPDQKNLAISAFDPYNALYTNGVTFLDRETGAADAQGGGGVRFPTGFGKNGGMGDIEYLCDLAPLQVGDYVWFDADADGVQDPSEKPVSGATVNLYDADGKKIATTKTSATGKYFFDSTVTGNVDAKDWKPKTKYRVALDNPADYRGRLKDWHPTSRDAGKNDAIDSDGVPTKDGFAEKTFTTGRAGEIDHTYDFGFTQGEVTEPPPTPPTAPSTEPPTTPPTTPPTVPPTEPTDECALCADNNSLYVSAQGASAEEPLPGASFQVWQEKNGTAGLQQDGDNPDVKVREVCTTRESDGESDKGTSEGAPTVAGECGWAMLPYGTYYAVETTTPGGYAAPESTVSDPAVLNKQHRDVHLVFQHRKTS